MNYASVNEIDESVCSSNQKWNHDECWCDCKKIDDWGSHEKGCVWNPRTCDCKRIKICKINKYLDTKNCSCKKCLIVKLVLACENEILNTTETSHDDKKVTCEENICLIHTVSLVIICLLLLAVSIGCFTITQELGLKKNIKNHINLKRLILKELNIKNRMCYYFVT